MKSFSQRYGYTPISKMFQIESIDHNLHMAIWNWMYSEFFSDLEDNMYNLTLKQQNFLSFVWAKLTHRGLDHFPYAGASVIKAYKEHLINLQWDQKYSQIEILYNGYNTHLQKKNVSASANLMLEENMSGYRFLDGMIVPITSDNELNSIQQVFEISEKYKYVKSHISRAAELLANKTHPDYRNSIKEAISGVESLLTEITGESVFSKAIAIIEKKFNIHKALKEGISKIYGYTSDAEGIRHALIEESNLTQDDAVFMLVSCSAFINYIIKKVK